MPQFSKLQRAIISRTAAGVLALGLLFGGYKCLRKGSDLERAARAHARQVSKPGSGGQTGGSGVAVIANLAGGALLLAGGMFALMAVVPAETFGRIMGPPSTTLYDNPGLDKARRWLQ